MRPCTPYRRAGVFQLGSQQHSIKNVQRQGKPKASPINCCCESLAIQAAPLLELRDILNKPACCGSLAIATTCSRPWPPNGPTSNCAYPTPSNADLNAFAQLGGGQAAVQMADAMGALARLRAVIQHSQPVVAVAAQQEHRLCAAAVVVQEQAADLLSQIAAIGAPAQHAVKGFDLGEGHKPDRLDRIRLARRRGARLHRHPIARFGHHEQAIHGQGPLQQLLNAGLDLG